MDQKSSDRSHPLYTLVNFPMELLVCIITFLTSTRDRVKLRYVSQRIRAAVEVQSLWKEFIWPNYDFREENAINSVFKSCGRHVQRLSFPNLVMPIESLQLCHNVIRLSLPSTDLSFHKLKKVLQCMKKLQYLDILWTSKNDIKYLLLMIGYPCCNIKELTIRERVKDVFDEGEIHFLLNEWTSLKLLPRIINIVTCFPFSVKEEIGQWVCSGIPTSTEHIGHLKVFASSIAGLTPPLLQYQIFGPHYLKLLYINVSDYGLFGLDGDAVLLAYRAIDDGGVICMGAMRKRLHGIFGVHGNPLNVCSIEFLTHFSAPGCSAFHSGHLEQLAKACPNLQQLSMQNNVNCLKRLQGLCAIANSCQKLKGLNIKEISVDDVESPVQLWELLVTLQLTHLCIDLCCLLCYNDEQTKQIIVGLHQKCFKMKALEVQCIVSCAVCFNKSQPLQLSNFPLLIHLITADISDVNICKRLKYFCYAFFNRCADVWWPWSIPNCNLQELYLRSCKFTLPESFMETISAHGGLVHVILDVDDAIENGLTALVRNSPNLITFHVYAKHGTITEDFILSSEKKFAERKLFLCGSCRIVNKRSQTAKEKQDLWVHGNMDCFSFWRNAPYAL